MKILIIRGKNLASLAEPFEVDLTAPPLRDCGVFAMSGPTGAGKSSILDALCLSLYASTPRLLRALRVQVPDSSGQDVSSDAATQLLRRGAGSGFAEVEFVGIDGRVYRARLSLRRANGRPSGKLQPPIHELFLRDEGRPCGGNNSETKAAIVEKLGLDFRQFTRAVLLAQNEFSAFLASDAEERAILLEKLTGTEQFGDLSVRSFDRAKRERAKLDLLDVELAAAPVLDDEALAALARSITELTEQLARAERQVAVVDARLGYEKRLEDLVRVVAAAEQELLAQKRRSDALLSERTELARLRLVMFEAKEPVEALQKAEAEWRRRELELGESARAVDEAVKLVQERQEIEQSVALALAESQRQKLEAQPLLRLAAVAEQELCQARVTREQQHESLRLAAERCAIARDELSVAHQRHEDIERQLTELLVWLGANPDCARLAEGWPAKRDALRRAVARLEQMDACQSKLDEAERELLERKTQATQIATDVEASKSELLADVSRAEALQTLARLDDVEALESTERNAERSLLGYDEMVQLLGELAAQSSELSLLQRCELEQRERLREFQQQVETCRLAIQLQRQESETKALELRGAEQMVGESVEALRATLREGEPCAVCGAIEHPFGGRAMQEVTARLRRRLESLRAAVGQLQQGLTRLQREEADALAEVARIDERIVSTERSVRAVAKECDFFSQRLTQFDGCPSAMTLGSDEERVVLLQRRGELAQALEVAAVSRGAAKRRAIEAQAATQRATASIARHAATETRLRSIERAIADLERDLAIQRERRVSLLTEQTRDLEPIESEPNFEDWSRRWRESPASCLSMADQAVAEWQARAANKMVLELERTKLLSQLPDHERRATERATEMNEAEQRHTFASAKVDECQESRAALFEGRRPEEVEAELGVQLQAATQNHDVARTQRVAAEQALAVALVKQDGISRALGIAKGEFDNRDQMLERWLETTRQLSPELAIERSELALLLQRGSSGIADIEARLVIAQTAVDRARGGFEQAVLARDTHRAQSDAISQALSDALVDAGATLPQPIELSTLVELGRVATLERERLRNERAEAISRRSDADERREAVGRKLSEREQQHRVAEKWQLLGSLIGSADGKRLRHLAQEVTLDLVLAHANLHLHDLARRYRLERLPEGLHIIVVDEELLGERRSVASLSGGETFLVSLALALGLASLSAEKIRVETLFIDEGFGSLDSVTLQIAVAALDRVQAQGRQVGVVSHVGDLAERLGVEVRVEPTGGGKSRVRILSRHGG